MTPPLDAYLVGLIDADLFTPAEHERGAVLTLRSVAGALADAGLPRTLTNVREYLRGFADHAGFLVAASKMGAVDYASGAVCS